MLFHHIPHHRISNIYKRRIHPLLLSCYFLQATTTTTTPITVAATTLSAKTTIQSRFLLQHRIMVTTTTKAAAAAIRDTNANDDEASSSLVDNKLGPCMEDITVQQQSVVVVVEQKTILRKSIRTAIKKLTINEIQQQSKQVWDKIYTTQQFQQAQTIGIFLSMPMGEINTAELIRYCCTSTNQQQQQKVLYVPIVGKNFEYANMELIKVDPTSTTSPNDVGGGSDGLFYEYWPKNKWNIPEPPETMNKVLAKPGDIDVIIVPGLAFDSRCNRLGQGKGYYDRYLARMKTIPITELSDETEQQQQQQNNNAAVKTPLLIGVGLDCQLLPEGTYIPTNEYDFPLDMVITPSRTIIN
jgi:5-formyltetrahydrofolate cyclo-ligase